MNTFLMVWWTLFLIIAIAQEVEVTITLTASTQDDCSACCDPSSFGAINGTSSFLPSCCEVNENRPLFGIERGECLGLPCCSYGGRKSQNGQAWFPCLVFPSCRVENKDFCRDRDNINWEFLSGSQFECTDACCTESVSMLNTWSGVSNAKPGQVNATFSITFDPNEYLNTVNSGIRPFKLKQIMIGAPLEYSFNREITTCSFVELNTERGTKKVNCSSSNFHHRSYLNVEIPSLEGKMDPFMIIFDQVSTPSGIKSKTDAKKDFSTTNGGLAPVHFIVDDKERTVYSSFYLVAPLTPAHISSGSFLPENIYPGSIGNATLLFYSDARIPVGGIISLHFDQSWSFGSQPTWSWKLQETPSVNEIVKSMDPVASSSDSEGTPGPSSELSSGSHVNSSFISTQKTPMMKIFSRVEYQGSNTWFLYVEEAPFERGWIHLLVDTIQNPSVAYSGLNQLQIQIFDAQKRVITEHDWISTISIETVDGVITSPYNYVTIVVLVGSLLFCSLAIQKNGLSFSLGSIWTDITAICTILALATVIINNILWLISRGSHYFYVSRLHLCFTFTMLTAVCFHWGTVLSLRLRKLPKLTTSLAFGLLNLSFYVLQLVFLILHRDLIDHVYEAENDPYSLIQQQCKQTIDGSNGNSTTVSDMNVFSDIQGYLWHCYANGDNFFTISTTITYALFLLLTVIVLVLGLLVLREGKLLMGNASGTHKIVLGKALRLYYALIGIVTVVYLLSWITQITFYQFIEYPWYYLLAVWLPYSIPPCCLIFLQWNSTANKLRKADVRLDGMEEEYVLALAEGWGDCEYEEIRTPTFIYEHAMEQNDTSLERWSDESAWLVGQEGEDGPVPILSRSELLGGGDGDTSSASSVEDYIGLSMCLEMKNFHKNGCFIVIQRLEVEENKNTAVWKRVNSTDTVFTSSSNGLSSSQGSNGSESGSVATISSRHGSNKHLYSFMSIPRIHVSLKNEKLRMIVYTRKEESEIHLLDESKRNGERDLDFLTINSFDKRHQSNLEILRQHPAMGSMASIDLTNEECEIQYMLKHAGYYRTSSSVNSSTLTLSERKHLLQSARVIDELFEEESEPESDLDADETSNDDDPAAQLYGDEDDDGDSSNVGRIQSVDKMPDSKLFKIVAEFSVSSDELIAAGARSEVFVVSGTANMNLLESVSSSIMTASSNSMASALRSCSNVPKLSIHVVLPKIGGNFRYGALKCSQNHHHVHPSRYVLNNRVAQSISSQYHIREHGLLVVEDLTESRFSNVIPTQFLQILLRHRAKEFIRAQKDLVRLDAYDQQRQKGTSRGMYENLIEQIQDDGDLNRCRVWMKQRLSEREEYVRLLQRLKHVYSEREKYHLYFKPSTEKKNSLLRFLPINLHLQEMWVGSAAEFHPHPPNASDENLTEMPSVPPAVYTIVTVGAMAAHLYKFKNGGILTMEEERQKMKCHKRSGRVDPMWSEKERKADDLDWQIQQRMDVCYSQALAALVTAFTRKIDLALQQHQQTQHLLLQLQAIGFIFQVESLLSTHGNEKGMLEDMAGAIQELRHVRFLLVGEEKVKPKISAENDFFAATKELEEDEDKTTDQVEDKQDNGDNMFAGVVRVDVFGSLEEAIECEDSMRSSISNKTTATSGTSGNRPQGEGTSSVPSASSSRGRIKSFGAVDPSKNKKYACVSSRSTSEVEFSYTDVVIRVIVRCHRIKVPEQLTNGTTIAVYPLLFTQGINEKQTIANRANSSLTQLQDDINQQSLELLRCIASRFQNYHANAYEEQHPTDAALVFSPPRMIPTQKEINDLLKQLEKTIAFCPRTRKKHPEVLQLSSDLCRKLGAGRVTVCKSAKDRTGMSVTLEQGRILEQNHGLPKEKRQNLVDVMRAQGVRIENAYKNTGRRVFAFNAIQRSLLPEEYRCPPNCGGSNIS